MPITPTYPGVYIEEVPSGVRTITPVATAITAFVGSAPRGLANEPVRVQSLAEFQRKFGQLSTKHPLTYAVTHYYQHSGVDALIVRVTPADAKTATISVGGLALVAASAGAWGQNIRAFIDNDTRALTDDENTLFNLFVYDTETRELEEYRNLSTQPDSPKFVQVVLEEESALVRVSAEAKPSGRPSASPTPKPNTQWFDDDSGAFAAAQGGADGGEVTEKEVLGTLVDKKGIYALEKADLFNLMCLPPIRRNDSLADTTWAEALKYCVARRAMLLIDPLGDWRTVDAAEKGVEALRRTLGSEDLIKNAALYFPRLKMSDPLKENRLAEFVPCGAIAGTFARTDVARGVWKAPAGIEAGLSGVREFSVKMTDPENGRLNPLAVNCLRSFRVYGNVIWGSRTMAGSDALGSDHKYVPVRRLTLFLEESLYRGTQWVVFEPNDEPLWAQIRLNVGVFMNDLFRQGAFQGRTASQAYFVRCSSETTTQSDINRGIVNIEVGFAPLKPAEFVIIKIQQIAGKLPT